MVKKVIVKKKKQKRELPEAMKAKQFKKGQSGNPLGGQLHNPIIKAMKQITEKALAETIEKIMISPKQAVKDMLDDASLSLAQRIVIKAAIKAESDGSFHSFNTILERVLGKVPDKVEIESPNGTMNTINFGNLKNLSDEDLKKLEEINNVLSK